MNISNKNHLLNSQNRMTFTVILFLLFSISLFAQKFDREKIKTLKIAHITEKLDFTKTEAQKFWPIYNANENAENELREKSIARRKEKNSDDLSESEAKTLLLDIEKFEKQKTDLKSKYLKELLSILPAKKIIKLYQAEHSFRQKMFDEYKKRHSND
ncbi:sensor of ECF-type sigma factor [Winogradskyella undariae]|uniref:sensor of ECF-type sigma factor n=1 Tax=Winogradskyella undariae TaxID=1285465 RepID=UPI00156B5F9E|nr:sensor of ECF-type sigma factor [Winogradskyella undariae]NRR90526.1 sensor of ECF-type sigma factor [Winogradskyella undariae]